MGVKTNMEPLIPPRFVGPNEVISIAPGFRTQAWPARILRCHSENLRMVEGREVPPVMKHGIAYAPGCCSDVTGAMEPVRVGLGMGRRTNMKMDVAGVGMLYDPAVDSAGALMRSDDRLGMNAAVYTGKVVNTIAEALNHFLQEPLQSIRFVAAFNLRDAAILYGQTDRILEVG